MLASCWAFCWATSLYAHASPNDPSAADLFASAGSALVAELDALPSGLTSVIVEVAVAPVDGRAALITGSGFEIHALDFVELATICSLVIDCSLFALQLEQESPKSARLLWAPLKQAGVVAGCGTEG